MTALLLAVFLGGSPGEASEGLPTRVRLAEVAPAAADLEAWRIGARLNIWTSFGEPANDITGGSLYVSHRLEDWFSPHWWATLEAYLGVFDFEEPGDAVLGTSGTPTADAKIRMGVLSATLEWHPLATDSPLDFYVGAGFGFVSLSDGEAEAPPIVDVDVTGGVGIELHLVVGAAYRLVGPLFLTADLRVMGVFASLEVEDVTTGDDGSIDSWDAVGFSFGLEARF
jgi:hypothetical protein